jgi:hypothetical protein
MNNDLSDCMNELVASEKLNIFNVIESFCDVCSDLTPHHIEEAPGPQEMASWLKAVAPISTLECVNCREQEENKLDGVSS